jgi:hypothetical protein
MALVLADRVRETTTTAGTGTITLLGAVPSCQSFAVVGDGNTTYYTIVAYSGTEWEVGIGTYTASGTTLSRDTVLSSSNSGSLVNFSAGTKDVFVDYPAGRAVYEDAAGNVDGYPITGGTINNTTIGATTPSTGVFTTLTATGQTSLGGVAGSEGLRVLNVASTVNYIQARGHITANAPSIRAAGSDTNIGLGLSSQGTGAISFYSSSISSEQMRVSHTPSAVNYVQVTGAATGGGPTISAQGSDTNVDLKANTKGTGSFRVSTGTGEMVRVADSSGTGYVQLSGGTTPYIVAQGSTNANLSLGSNGTGTIFVRTNGGGTTQAAVSHTASAVNYVQVTGAATGGAPTVISSQGSDAAVNLRLSAKGSSTLDAQVNSTTRWKINADGSVDSGISASGGISFKASATGSQVNYLQSAGAVVGSSPILSSQGSDTNISQVFQSKGTGAIDLAAGSSGVNISNGGTVTAITRTASGSAYTSVPSVAITAPTTAGGVQATASVGSMFTNTATVQSGGTGYTNGDVLTIVGGTAITSAATYTVTGVSGGAVTSVTPLNFNQYSVLPTNPVSTTGGTGSGATLNLTYGIGTVAFTITNAGSGYVEQPTVTFSGGGGSGAAAYATVGSSTTLKTLAFIQNFDTSGGTQFQIQTTSGNNAYPVVTGGVNGAALFVAGSATNAGLLLATKGTSAHDFYTNGFSQLQARIAHTASAVNYVQVMGAATGSSVVVSSQGSDTNIGMIYNFKGTASHSFNGNNGTHFQVTSVASGANFLRATGAAASSAPVLSAQGSDTNIDLNLNPKGTGQVKATNATNMIVSSIGQGGFGSFLAQSSTGSAYLFGYSGGSEVGRVYFSSANSVGIATSSAAAQQFVVTNTASAVNYVQVTGAATGGSPTISSQGSDSNIGLELSAKGTSSVNFRSGSSAVFQAIMNTGGDSWLAANRMTGNANLTASSASASNVSLSLQSKGTGAIDLAAGSSGVNISNGGTVTAITRTASGSNYTSFPTIAISAPTTAGGVQATVSVAFMRPQNATIGAGGTGYTVNDVLTIVGGTPTAGAATFTVTAVSGGVITAASPTNFATYSVLPTNPVSVTGGTGSGATLNIAYGLSANPGSFTITNAGSGYVEQPTVTFSGGGGSGAAAYATVGSGTVVKSLGSTMSFSTAGGEQLRVGDTFGGGVSTNYWLAQGRASSQPLLSVAGADVNINAVFTSKGTGQVSFNTNYGAQEQLRVTHTASAVNYVQVTGAATGTGGTISAQGSDTNIPIFIQAKNSGWVESKSNGKTAFIAYNASSSAVNYIQVDGKVSGTGPSISALGSDTNIDLTLTPKGTGLVRFGTYTGTALSIAGYIEIKTADGTVRKLAVVA